MTASLPGNHPLTPAQEAGVTPATAWADAPCAHITRLVAAMLDVPVALLSLPRAEEYRFRVNIGLDGFESVPSRISFCAYTMLGTDVLMVPDSRLDARFRQNPLVLGDPRIIAYLGVPLISSRGITLGTICAIDRRPRTFTPAQLDHVRGVARVAAWLLEAEAAHRDEQAATTELTRQIEEGRDSEREQFAIALHEGVAQDLFALRLQLQRLRASRAWRPEADIESAAAFTHSLDRTINDVCSIANGLMPQGSAHLRVTEAIRLHAHDIAQQTGLEIEVHEVGVPVALDAGTRLLLLRAAREALVNVARHARACRVSITLESSAQVLRLRVMDDGVGVGPDALSHPGGLGLAGLRERACAVGGALQVERNSRGGTTLSLHLPGIASSTR